MKRTQPATHRAHRSCDDHCPDELTRLLQGFAVAPSERSAAERWQRLAQRASAHRYMHGLIAHMQLHGSEVYRATLLLRPWSSLMFPLA